MLSLPIGFGESSGFFSPRYLWDITLNKQNKRHLNSFTAYLRINSSYLDIQRCYNYSIYIIAIILEKRNRLFLIVTIIYQVLGVILRRTLHMVYACPMSGFKRKRRSKASFSCLCYLFSALSTFFIVLINAAFPARTEWSVASYSRNCIAQQRGLEVWEVL